MSLTERVVAYLSDTADLYECRRCGTSAETRLSQCPECDSTDISQISLEE
jgi:anaerobic ribonucleoside-triphosphate reductase